LTILLLVIDSLLDPSLWSFTLTSSIFVFITILLTRVSFKRSAKVSTWFSSEPSETHSKQWLIEGWAITVEEAAKGHQYPRREIAEILRGALACRYGSKSDFSSQRFIYGENVRNELARIVGEDEKVMEIFDPQEGGNHKGLLHRRSLKDEEKYLSTLEEAIRIVKEGGV
jgi:hypothetical protein